MNNETPEAPRGHHPDSPSSLQPSAACPHYENRNEESAASAAGTLQHKAAETRDLSILESEEQTAAVKRCLDLQDATAATLQAYKPTKLTTIHEIYLPVIPGHKNGDWEGLTGGYPDTLIVADYESNSVAALLDWKFGQMLVTPTKDNLQGKAYALAVLQKYPRVSEVKVQFYHPYLELPEAKPEYTHVFSRNDMPQLELEIRLVIARKRRAKTEGWASDIKPCPSTNLCCWCARLAECPAVLSLATTISPKHAPLLVPAEMRPSYLTDPAAAKQAYQMAQVLEPLAKAIRKRLTDMVLTEGFEVEGMQIVTKADREITSIEAVREAALQHGVDEAEFTELLTLSITKVEEAVKKKAPRGKGAAAVRALAETLDELGATKKGKPYSYLKESKDDAIDV